MKTLTLFVLFFICLNQVLAEPIGVSVGDQVVLEGGSGQVLVTNPGILKVFPKGKKVEIYGVKKGEAIIKRGNKKWELTVLSSQMAPVLSAINNWKKDTPGVELAFKSTKILIKGQPLRTSDWIEGAQLSGRYKQYAENQMSVGPQIQTSVKRYLKDKLKQRAIVSASVENCGNELCLFSSATSRAEISAIEQIGKIYGIEVQQKATGFDLKPMVEIEVLLVEVRTNHLTKLGIKLPGQYSATVMPSSDLSSFSTTFGGMMPKLDLDEQDHSGKVLANPKLICRSGDTASFLAGGEIPIRVANWKNNEVTWKKYGIVLNFSPVTDGEDLISTKVLTEISLLDETKKIDGIPGMLTNRIETHFNLKGSKTIALSGLLKSEIGRTRSGTPFLSDIPIIGELFKSRDYQDKKTELVVLVTPRIIHPDEIPDLPRVPVLDEE